MKEISPIELLGRIGDSVISVSVAFALKSATSAQVKQHCQGSLQLWSAWQNNVSLSLSLEGNNTHTK